MRGGEAKERAAIFFYNKCRRLIELEHHHFAVSKIISDFRQAMSKDAKTIGWVVVGNRIFTQTESTSTEYLLTTKVQTYFYTSIKFNKEKMVNIDLLM